MLVGRSTEKSGVMDSGLKWGMTQSLNHTVEYSDRVCAPFTSCAAISGGLLVIRAS